jgi:hypothetical protein
MVLVAPARPGVIVTDAGDAASVKLGPAAMTMLHEEVVEFEAESTTLAVKLKLPAVVGLPEIKPLDPVRFRPGGSDPLLIEKVSGGTPPVDESEEL